ncbi:methylmalonyl-CoA mutase [Thermodesulfobacteriota bacterium]
MSQQDKLSDIESHKKDWENQAGDQLTHNLEIQGDINTPPQAIYTPVDIGNHDYTGDLGFPGEYPYTRGIWPGMFRSRLWTMRQYAGFGTSEETNERFKYLLQQGMKGMNIAFDLPSQIGYDSDHPRAQGEVGNVGIACPSLKEMEVLFDGIPLEKVSPAMAINATAQIMLAMYIAIAQKQGLALRDIAGSTQNDILKEFIARGTYIFPPRPSLRLSIDLFEYCSKHMPRWNFINICGYHMREAGSTLIQEVAFAMADAITYVEAAIERGLDLDDFAPRIAFNFSITTNLFEEIAKLRATRRLWAHIMRERYGAKNPASWKFRTGAGSAGCTLTAQQPENNIVRVTIQSLASVLGGAQSLHTASMDEALSLPTEKAVTIALRTQQIIAHESGVAQTVDPMAGSYYVESLTNQVEEEVKDYLERIEAVGGMLNAIESGWVHKEIAKEAYRHQREVESGERVIVGVNRYTTEEPVAIEIHRMDPEIVERVQEKLRNLRKKRDSNHVRNALLRLKEAALGDENLMPFMLEAVKSYATVGEICDNLREVFGEYQRPPF